MDNLTPQQRSKYIAAIHNKNTKPEIIVRKGLLKRGNHMDGSSDSLW